MGKHTNSAKTVEVKSNVRVQKIAPNKRGFTFELTEENAGLLATKILLLSQDESKELKGSIRFFIEDDSLSLMRKRAQIKK